MPPQITAVSLSLTHAFSKTPQPEIHLLTALGVEGDAHCGTLVQHRYHIRKDQTKPNLCQVHLLHHELLDELHLQPGQIGENITTRNLNLLELPTATRLHLGLTAVVQITGLRTPCIQMNTFRPSLMQACFHRNAAGIRSPRAGIMAIVLTGGAVHPGDPITVVLPPEPHHPQTRV